MIFLHVFFGHFVLCPYMYPSYSQVALVVKNLPANADRYMGCEIAPWVRKILWKRKWQPTPVFLPGESHEQRSLARYSPWDQKESYTIE